MPQRRETPTTITTFNGDTMELNGIVALEFIAEGERGAEMRDRLAKNMPGLIMTFQLLDMGTYALIALRNIPKSVAEYCLAWSTVGLIAERILNSPMDPEGREQEPIHARLNPEGASPEFKVYLGHDPDAVGREDEDITPLDWRSLLRETPPDDGEPETSNRKWLDTQSPLYPPENSWDEETTR